LGPWTKSKDSLNFSSSLTLYSLLFGSLMLLKYIYKFDPSSFTHLNYPHSVAHKIALIDVHSILLDPSQSVILG
jgi:hypothetical protein